VAAKDVDHIFGPYLKAVPGLPVAGTGTTGGKVGDTGVGAGDLADIGWLYDDTTGAIIANTGTSADESGDPYSGY
jgi:hypothetical protein